jgi:alpha-beta hydrolase superfamily lysophospholipase
MNRAPGILILDMNYIPLFIQNQSMMKRKFYYPAVVLILLFSQIVSAQNTGAGKTVTGSWLGKINTGALELRIVFNISIVKNDSLVATLDSPDQGAKGIKIGPVTFEGDSLAIAAPLLRAGFRGELKNDTTIDGEWRQAGVTFPLVLTKLRKEFTVNRPQEPKPPFPYESVDVTFSNNRFNIKLAGTLTIPEGAGPFPAVVLVTGSGPQNRNEELLGHKPFLVIADYLTRHGIAVLRYDDRGVGKSQGNYGQATSADLATDAEAAWEYLKSQPVTDNSRIGILGHSEGGLIAPMIASKNDSVAFIVSLAGPGITGEKIILKQSEDIGRLMGESEENIRESTEINTKLYEILKKEKDNKVAEEKIIAAYRDILAKEKLPPDDIDKAVNKLQATFGANAYTWFRYFIMTDPAIFWEKVKCPVLALNGDKDLQVNAQQNLQAIKKALESSGNNNVETIVLPGLNHLFQHCSEGLPSEYSGIEETFSPEVLKIIADWIVAL